MKLSNLELLSLHDNKLSGSQKLCAYSVFEKALNNKEICQNSPIRTIIIVAGIIVIALIVIALLYFFVYRRKHGKN